MAVIETDTFAGGIFRWKFSSLGHRVVSLTLLTSTVFAFVATSVQMTMLFFHERGKTLHVFEQIEMVYLRRVEQALWPLDEAQLNFLLDGIYARPDVTRVEIVHQDAAQRDVSRGIEAGSKDAARLYALSAPTGVAAPPAHLSVTLSFDRVWQTVQRHVLTTLLTDLAKAVAIGTLMLWIFDRLATRRLRLLANQVLTTTWRDTVPGGNRNHTVNAFPDEIDGVIEALEQMRAQARTAYESLASANAHTETLNIALAAANREQAELTSALSHDLVTPVNTLHMLMSELQILHKCGTLEGGEAAATLTDAHKTLERMRAQIQGVVQYSALLSTDPKKVAVDLDTAMASQLDRVHQMATDYPARFDCTLLGRAMAEPQEVKILFYELLRNAVLYRAEGRENLITIRRFSPNQAGFIGVEVADTGCGVEPSQINLAFQLFARLSSYAAAPGSGVGLVLCRRIVERHGGTITMVSDPGVGTCVRVTLPAEVPDG